MRCLHFIICAVLMLLVLPCDAETLLKLASPDKKLSLVVLGVASPDSPNVIRTLFSIIDARGKVIKEVGATEFPVIAVKWHKDGRSLLVIEHISRQVVMRLITLNGGEWKMVEVAQFKNPPNNFSLVNAESQEFAFLCYYLGRNNRDEDLTAYRTQVNTQNGESILLSSKKVPDEDFKFYKSSIGKELYRIDQAIEKSITQYASASDDEPSWVMPNSGMKTDQ